MDEQFRIAICHSPVPKWIFSIDQYLFWWINIWIGHEFSNYVFVRSLKFHIFNQFKNGLHPSSCAEDARAERSQVTFSSILYFPSSGFHCSSVCLFTVGPGFVQLHSSVNLLFLYINTQVFHVSVAYRTVGWIRFRWHIGGWSRTSFRCWLLLFGSNGGRQTAHIRIRRAIINHKRP